MQNDGLKKAIVNKRKRRKREKPLHLDFPKDEYSGAIFYSPNKIQQARNRQAQKKAKAETNQMEKEEAKTRREVEKAEKARLVEECRVISIYNKKMKAQEQKRKHVLREEQKLQKQINDQLRKDIKQAPKDKRKKIMPIILDQEDEVKNVIAEEVIEVPRSINRRGRQINLPERFRK